MRGLVAYLVVLALPAAAPAAPPPLAPQPLVSGLAAPVEIAHANDGSGRLFIVEQAGRIRIFKNGALLPTPFLDITSLVRSGGEQGLLGLAFHPSYLTNGRFFVYYTRQRPGDAVGSDIVVGRYRRSAADPDVADPVGDNLFLIGHPDQANHNGGKLAFGFDGYLYIGVGDGGGGNDPFDAGQNTHDLRGKLLRVGVDVVRAEAMRVRSNPYGDSGDPPGHPFVWAYGLRNPWRFSFDRAAGDLFIADVGQNAWEEVNLEPRGVAGGRNYGWRVFEGTHCFDPPIGCSLANHTLPIIEYAHGSDGFSVTGGYRYRGTALPALWGYYVYGDYVSGRVWAAAPDGAGTWIPTQVATVASLAAFGEDEYGELYAVDRNAGAVLRLTPAASPGLAGTPVVRYRLYNPQSFDHLLTTDANEHDTLTACCGWRSEGITHRVLAAPGSVGGVAAVPNYRLYSPQGKQHHWTTDANEYAVLPSYGWVQEGLDGYLLPTPASGTIPLYRLYQPPGSTSAVFHLWTADPNERGTLLTGSWIDEGIAGYVLPP